MKKVVTSAIAAAVLSFAAISAYAQTTSPTTYPTTTQAVSPTASMNTSNGSTTIPSGAPATGFGY